jgi:hypothetical protein
MAKRAIVLIVVSGLLAAACGCNVCRAILYDPFGPNTLCDGRRCGTYAGPVIRGPVCDEECGPGPIRAGLACRGPLVGPCGDGCCDDCGGPTCRHHCGIIRGPLTLVFALFGAGAYRCGPCGGCGERYWGDWYGDPPECCDPCDSWGNFTGGSSNYGDYAGAPLVPTPGPYDDADTALPPGGVRMAPPQPGGCRNCGQGGHAARSYPGWRPPAQYSSSSPNASGSYASTPRSSAPYGPRQHTSSQHGPSAYASGRYAPRVLSTTDRVVKPATAQQTPHLAEPLRPDVRQE